MEINRVVKILIVTFFIFSCKENIKNKNNLSSNSNIEIVTKKEETEKKEIFKQDELRDFIKEFYSKYLSDLNNHTNACDFKDYFSDEFIDYINKVNYANLIIDAQDYEKFDLSTLKIIKTHKDKIYKVEFVNMGYQTIIYAKVKLVKDDYKIVNLTTDVEKIDEYFVYSITKTNDFEYYAFEHKINPGEYNEEISCFIDYLEENYIVFQITDPDYKCRQERTKEGISLYYVEAEAGEYKGDTSKPLMKIYKKGNDFYAKSSLIENGKEVKLKEVESRY